MPIPSHDVGIFVSFEGIDGAGKSTHISALAEALRAAGRIVTLSREPGGTPLAEKLRAMVLNDAMDPLTEALLMFAARRDHIVKVIAPALQRGEVVLCDRFTDATFAYQGGGRGFDGRVLSELERWVQSGFAFIPNMPNMPNTFNNQAVSESAALLQPNLTVWFDLPPEEAAQRLVDARVPDKFEAQPVAFFRRVVQGYTDRMQADPERFVRIDAAPPRDVVWHSVKQVFVAKGWLA